MRMLREILAILWFCRLGGQGSGAATCWTWKFNSFFCSFFLVFLFFFLVFWYELFCIVSAGGALQVRIGKVSNHKILHKAAHLLPFDSNNCCCRNIGSRSTNAFRNGFPCKCYLWTNNGIS